MLVFMLPFVVSLVLFIFFAVGIFMLLARIGLLPGFVFKTYRFTTKDSNKNGRAPEGTNRSAGWTDKSWYQDNQDGEIITLPETALKKDEKDG
jgi:hypothetical protein